MRLLQRLLAVSFLESFATICVERGGYFYTHDRLSFTLDQNLWLAFGFGAFYVAGASLCNRISRLWGEKRLMTMMIAAQALCNVLMVAFGATPWAYVALTMLLAISYGLKWPLLESYVAAGLTPRESASAVGKFNVAWAGAIPLALIVTGPLVAPGGWWPGLFLLPVLISVVDIWLLRPVEPHPRHLAADHPARPSVPQMARYKALLLSARVQMLCSYCLLFILAALLPQKLDEIGMPQSHAPAFSGLIDVVRLASFVLLALFTGWHNRVSPLVLTVFVLPPAFAMVLLPSSTGMILAGELACGLAAGLTYYSSLYYAMVVKNAAVDAGGAHESLVGLGFAVGPLMALAGSWITRTIHCGPWCGVMAGATPVILLCMIAGLWPLLRMPRKRELNQLTD
jgi:MFS family permease